MFDTAGDFSTGFDTNSATQGAIAPFNPLTDTVQLGKPPQNLPVIPTLNPISPDVVSTSFKTEAPLGNIATEITEANAIQSDSLLGGGTGDSSQTGQLVQSAFKDTVGTFVVGNSGQTTIDFLFDGGVYTGQLAVFSLEGMDSLNQSEFIQEAARRASSNSTQGQIVISDRTESAQFSGKLGKKDFNSGATASTQTLLLQAGDQFAVMLVPNGSVNDVMKGRQKPFFSLSAFNPGKQTQIGQVAEGVFAFEDLVANRGDRDFNDVVFRVTGATAIIDKVENLIDPNKNWLNSPVAQLFLKQPTFSNGEPDQPIAPVNDPNDESTDPPAEPIPSTPETPVAEETSSEESSTSEQSTEDTSTENPSTSEQSPEDTSPEDTSTGDSSTSEQLPVEEAPLPTYPEVSAISETVAKFSGNTTEPEIIASGAQTIKIGTQTIYIGTEQVSKNNQNPIIRSFDSENSTNNWTRQDIETSKTDSRGVGLFWTGNALYGVFTVDGTQNDGQDFRRATSGAKQQWLKSYGTGGGSKISVLGQIDPNTGELLKAAYLSAVLNSGKTNSLVVTGISTNSDRNIVVEAQSYFAPRQPDGSAKKKDSSNSKKSPYDYTIEIKSDLSEVVSTFAPGWT